VQELPVLFMSHGSPMNIIEKNSFTHSLSELGKTLAKPEAIMVISAHWLTKGTKVTCLPNPRTIYDFYGFPEELYKIDYPCPGAPQQAEKVVKTLGSDKVSCDFEWGIDHAAWSVLKYLYPQADIPVFEMSLDVLKSPQEHYDLAQELAPLRKEGILVVASGNPVHNLRRAKFDHTYAEPYPWAIEADQQMKGLLQQGDHASLIQYEGLSHASLTIPTTEHYLPMLYAVALQKAGEELAFTCEDIQNGSVSMRSFVIGG